MVRDETGIPDDMSMYTRTGVLESMPSSFYHEEASSTQPGHYQVIYDVEVRGTDWNGKRVKPVAVKPSEPAPPPFVWEDID